MYQDSNIGVAISTFYETVKTYAVGLWTKFKEGIDEKWGEIIAGITKWITGDGGIVSTLTDLYESIKTAGLDLIQGLWDGMMEKWNAVSKWFTSLANQMPAWLKKLLGIKSPSRVLMEIGGQIVQGLVVGLENGTPDLQRTTELSLGQPIMSVGKSMFGQMSAVGVPATMGSPISITLNIDSPVVRSEKDIDEITRKVSETMMKNLERYRRNGGHTF